MEYLVFAGLALLASACNTIFNRISANKIGTVLSSAIKALFIVVACLVISLSLGHANQLYNLTKDQWLWIFVAGGITCFDWIFYFLSIKRAHLEAFAPFETSAVLFFSNLIFTLFMFASVTKNGSPVNTILLIAGLLFFVGGMVYAVLNKKINPTTKKIWVLYAALSAMCLGFTLLVVKQKLSDVPSDVISYHQMFIVFIVTTILLLVTKQIKEIKTVKLLDYGKFFIAAVFNALLMVFRYKAFSYSNAIPSVVNVLIALDFIIVSLATVLFFKAKNKKQLLVLISIITIGIVLNLFSGLL